VGHKKVREKIKKFLEFNENESTTCHNLWFTAKAVLKAKFIAMNIYIDKLLANLTTMRME
jgi:hypothetical protein